MPDWDGNDLGLLAPEVDHAAARALFDRRRVQRHRRRRFTAVGGGMALVLVGVIAATSLLDDGNESLQVGPADEPTTSLGGSDPNLRPDQGLFELLDLREGAAFDMGTLRSAVDADELAQLWSDAGFADEAPVVDFGQWVVVSITIPDDACPPRLSDFTRDGDVWTPVFVEPSGGCVEPLIPKTYVVAINRSEATPGFTLHLEADSTFGFDDQLLEIDVPPADAPTTIPGSDTPDVGPELGRVPLPPVGEAGSGLLDDGMPVWVVHHDDGTVSALPAVVPGLSLGDSGIEKLWTVVRWSPSGELVGPIRWDAWGRALTDGRDHDLVNYAASVVDGEVVVSQSAATRVPGSPEGPADSGGDLEGGWIEPELPPLAALDAIPAGWSQLDATLVGHAGEYRVCPIDPNAPISETGTCPDDAPLVESFGAAPAGQTSWNYGPLVVEADADGQIIHIAGMGGYSSAADEFLEGD